MGLFVSRSKAVKKFDCIQLKLTLKLASQRLAFIQKKKAEFTNNEKIKIAYSLKDNDVETARIKVQDVIRDDITAEAYGILEAYCNHLLVRFSVIEEIKELDPSIAEAVSGLCWASSRVSHEINEFKDIPKEFAKRYGHKYVKNAVENNFSSFVPEKLIRKITFQPLSAQLVERYLVEIAAHYSINFTPDFNSL